jgi:hypothetical protein
MSISGSVQDGPLFLRLPHEIRDHIYGYMLTLDRGPECAHPAICRQAGEEILGLLGVNRQVRNEARGVLERNNVWIRFTTGKQWRLSSRSDAKRSLSL